ncbi:hypothetical protein BO70DRAFT_382492 [Aspergillus heteromorphus CBS 117.55]|uniref:Uncharacterized protein n=1 Tax=Aspergillus heteromorphus CBS 117.55 TaxID=1448321 RepID=A0A317V9V0_9EURO|nr:uncharacterized protein BO70DRAFT_382492 [Aspergillus heteromorphus CBS 117.55]PWY69787.1 hypothetical protein BO70DRAFT_382492 [Aspergillus heteromorphus CBS 117.55]
MAENEQFLSEPHPASGAQLATTSKDPISKWDSLILDTWFWEIISLGFSITLFIVIVVFLKVYDQHEMPTFPLGLTLNTIVSILATGSKSSLLCMISTSIGQLKWIWFQAKKRPLYDMQYFDDASRGPWGSMQVLTTGPRQGNILLSIGAIITIMALTFGPFMQQIVRFPVRQAIGDHSNATAKQAILPFPEIDEVDDTLLMAMEAGVWSTTGFVPSPSCPSGNCTWSSFKSAGWCSKCENVTSKTASVGCDITSFNTSRHEDQTVPCKITFPDGSWITSDFLGVWNKTAQGLVISIPYIQLKSVNDQKGPYLNQTILGVYSPLSVLAYVQWQWYTTLLEPSYSVNSLQRSIKVSQAIECVLSPCVRAYNISVSMGVLSIQHSPPDFGEIFHPECYPGMDVTLQQFDQGLVGHYVTEQYTSWEARTR